MSPHEQMKEGLYRGRPISLFAGSLDNDKGTEFFAVRFEVQEIYQDGEWMELAQARKRDVKFWATKNAADWTTEKMESLGLDLDHVCEALAEAYGKNGKMLIGDGGAGFADHCYDPGVKLRCTYDHNDGNTYENWELAQDGGGMDAGVMSEDTMAMFKSHTSSGNSSSEDEEQDSSAEDEMDVSDSEIPF